MRTWSSCTPTSWRCRRGRQPQDARFLFVIDQFEELFHPTTRHVEDARLLVERVIDHFFSPHPRCYVVLTMRSEHLNDCASFLELPDAINKASYLVRRLDDSEMHDAIVCPAERLLRLRQLADEDAARLPQELQFSAEVTARLLKDVRAISDDPDHLPLLQHVLARIWQAACTRVAPRLDLPDRIEPGDLEVAASALPSALAPPLTDDLNVLRASLERWAEAAYQRHGEAQRAVLDVLLRKLAVKDPNTGMYSQQRVHVDDCLHLLGAQATRADLKALLAKGFLGEVDYLYWDDDDPQRITLKVSHESLIRGWPRLRQAIDHEAERFAAFVELLRKCEDWKRNQGSEELLLEAGDLRRASDAAVEVTLANGNERAAWFRRLQASPSHAHLAALDSGDEGPGAIDAFLQASTERQRQRQDSESRRRRNRQLLILVFLLLVPMGLYGLLVQGPVIQRTSLLFKAGSIANATPLRRGQPDVGSEAPALRNLVDAAALIDRGRRGDSRHPASQPPSAASGFRPCPSSAGRRSSSSRSAPAPSRWSMAACASCWSRPSGTRNCRSRCPTRTRSPWPRGKPACPAWSSAPAAPSCWWASCSRAFNTSNPKLSRSIFVPDASGTSTGREEVELFAANVKRQAPFGCMSRQVLMKIPKFLAPEIAFDANLRFFMYVGTDSAKNPVEKTLTLNEILWERADDEGGRSVLQPGARGAERRACGRPAEPGRGHARRRPARRGPARHRAHEHRAGLRRGRAGLAHRRRGRAAHPRSAPTIRSCAPWRPRALARSAWRWPSCCSASRNRASRWRCSKTPATTATAFRLPEACRPMRRRRPTRLSWRSIGKPTARALNATGAPAPIASLPRFGRVTPGEAGDLESRQGGLASGRLDRRLEPHRHGQVAPRGGTVEHLCAVAPGQRDSAVAGQGVPRRGGREEPEGLRLAVAPLRRGCLCRRLHCASGRSGRA